MKAARIYVRVGTDDQDLARQARLEAEAQAAGFHVAGVYAEKGRGARADRRELLRLIEDLQPGDVVIAESIDRISRLRLSVAEALVDRIRAAGARLSVPGLVDLSDLVASPNDVAKIVLETVQELLLRILLQTARGDYEARRQRQQQGIEVAKQAGKYRGRAPNLARQKTIVALRTANHSIRETAQLAGCSRTWVKHIWAAHKAARATASGSK